MTEREFATWLRAARGATTHEDCVRIEERIDRVQHQHDVEQGDWINPHEFPHHYGEAAH